MWGFIQIFVKYLVADLYGGAVYRFSSTQERAEHLRSGTLFFLLVLGSASFCFHGAMQVQDGVVWELMRAASADNSWA